MSPGTHTDTPAMPVLVAIAAAAAPVVGWLAAFPSWTVAALAVAGVVASAAVWAANRGSARAAVEAERSRISEAARELEAAKAGTAAVEAELGRLEQLLAAMDEPLLGIDADGRIVVCNPAAEALLYIRADRVLGRPMEEAITQTEVLSVIAEARAGRAVLQQIRVPRADGMRVWEISAQPAAGAGPNRPIAACIRDVTAAAMALQVKADFVANASHELRTPIAAMRIAVDTLGAVEPDDTAMHDRLMTVISTNVGRLEEMVRDLLDLSRLESPDVPAERSALPISEITRELSAMFESACLQRRLTLEFDTAPGLDSIQTDRRLLILILGNLIDNATKYAFEGTPIRVVARRVNGDGGVVRFEVTDRGMGIPLDQQSRIFERYYQVNAARTTGEPRRGTGLGLSIVKHALRRLGGTIKVNSVWQQGTTMTVDLPDALAAHASR
jgi:two-component system phosphate regulon sensor histidine kinase PhoR